MDPRVEAPTFKNYFAQDGSIEQTTVSHWPEHIEISHELLEIAHEHTPLLTVDGDMVSFRVANGSADYRMVERRGHAVRCVREVSLLLWTDENNPAPAWTKRRGVGGDAPARRE